MKTKITRTFKQLILAVLIITGVLAMSKVNAQNTIMVQDEGTTYHGKFITNILIYPNPTHDLVILKGEVILSANVDMKIMDILGRTIIERTEVVTPGLYQHNFDLSDYANGIYLLEIRSGNQVVTTRLIKN